MKNEVTRMNSANFYQEGPVVRSPFLADDLLRSFLRWRAAPDVCAELEEGLTKLSNRLVSEVEALGERAESQPPVHVPFDPWGRRIDHIEVSSAWLELHRFSAEEGMIATGYERAQGAFSRVHQFARLFLFHPSSAFYTCPLAMTDGAARVLELSGIPELRQGAFRHLISRIPAEFWTSGQWMTERTGGSDVSATSTIAKKENGVYRLYGDKWFTSATTSEMSLALAKVEGANDPRGGLSLFYVELRDTNGRLKKIRINRLKDKLGTRALPTAELTLEGLPARMIGETGEGVKRVSALLNITRLYNSVCALATIFRGLQLAKDYATKRTAFGRELSRQPLHLQTLASVQTEYEATFHIVFQLAHWLGKEETSAASSEESALLRLLTPIAKLYSAKQAIALTSEVIESFGGAGYIEDTGLPRLLRDAQVYSIWEGTTNVLSLDVLRALGKDGSLPIYLADIERRLRMIDAPELKPEVETVRESAGRIARYADTLFSMDVDSQQAGARGFAWALGRVFAASLMLEFAQWSLLHQQRASAPDLARRFCRTDLTPLVNVSDLHVSLLRRGLFGD